MAKTQLSSLDISLGRRAILAGFGLGGLAALGGCASVPAMSQNFFDRVGLPIGVQLYMLGDDASHDFDATFARVAEIGYREVELPNLGTSTAAQVRAAADRAGLSIASLHVPLAGGLSFGGDPAQLAEALHTLGASWAVAPICMLPADFSLQQGESFGVAIARSVGAAGEDIWRQCAGLLNESAAALAPLGIGVAYHNHNIEFAPIGNTTGWDILFAETDPALVHFEVDTGWVATAGLDVVPFIDRCGGRIRLLHVKDVAADNPQSFAINMNSTEVGAGTLPMPAILDAAYSAGARHFLVEQEPPYAIPRIEAATRSYTYLANM